MFDMDLPLHDAFRRGGLGRTAAMVWYLLIATPGMGAADIALELRIHRSTAYRNLGRLANARLVRCEQSLWYPMKRDLDTVASELGTAGTLDRQRQMHKRQRRGFAQALTPQDQRPATN